MIDGSTGAPLPFCWTVSGVFPLKNKLFFNFLRAGFQDIVYRFRDSAGFVGPAGDLPAKRNILSFKKSRERRRLDGERTNGNRYLLSNKIVRWEGAIGAGL